ncbi:ATP-binding protein [Acinetobacter baumannii]
MQQGHKELLFTRFGRLPGHVGIGLGLYVVKEVLAAHGSSAELADTEDGTVITFSLPVR